MINNRFKSGKFQGKTYLEVWKTDKSYLYWMAGNFSGDYWSNIVRILEERDKQLSTKPKVKDYPTTETVRKIFQSNSILGFDLSDYICDLYESTPNHLKSEYFLSLLERNKINV